jgi:putative ABC transport system ATP-binding protein
MTRLLEARGVTKDYRRGSETVHALRGVDFALAPEEVVALIGPSGSGKSTLLNLLAGWEQPDGGTLLWQGQEGAPPTAWSDVAIVPQKLGLINELTVEENVTLPLRLWGRQSGITPEALMEELGLSRFAPRLPLEISVGEQQRTALARALVLGPALLLLDEPTGHQDAGWAEVVFGKLRDAARAGACCFVATHNPEVLPFTDRILEIRDGRLHETDSPSVLIEELEAEINVQARKEGPEGESGGVRDDNSAWRRRD